MAMLPNNKEKKIWDKKLEQSGLVDVERTFGNGERQLKVSGWIEGTSEQQGKRRLSDEYYRLLFALLHTKDLTKEERQIIEWKEKGYIHKEIAGMLGVSEGTIDKRVTRIEHKYGIVHHPHRRTHSGWTLRPKKLKIVVRRKNKITLKEMKIVIP